MKKPQTISLLYLILILGTASLFAEDVYVSPAGNDQNPGTQQKPFSSIQKAFTVMQNAGPGTIWLAEGAYYVEAGIKLNKPLNGSKQNSIVIRSTIPHKARINGARKVLGFKQIPAEDAKSLISEEAKEHVLVSDLKAQGFPPLGKIPDKFNAPGIEEVIFGDLLMQSARWPNEGFVAFTEVVDPGASDPIHWVTREVYRPGSFRFPSDRAKYWDISRGVYLHGFWCYEWADEALKVATYNAKTAELRFAAKHAYGIGNPRKKKSEHRFYALHVFEELDQPGEYYLDRKSNKLYFWPPSDITKTPVYLSVCRKLLLDASGVSNLSLKDLVFENGCNWAVQFEDCTNSKIENCLVHNMGLGGIKSNGGSNNHVIRCEVTHTGSMAVSMSAGDRKSLTKGNCSVIGNHLHHIGRYDWFTGRGISLGGCGNRVANNHIHHGPTSGIAYGGNEHMLELNEVHNVCMLYSDVGVFYTGRDWASRGNIVRWNYVHNSDSDDSQAFYIDDCDSGDTIIGNIVFGGVGRGVLLGGGRDNTLRGNIFIDLPTGIRVDARGPKAITLDQPGSWNLKAKCEELDYLSPLWMKRYPHLARVLYEDPLLPRGNVMKNNIFISCKKQWDLAQGVMPEWLSRENNQECKMSDFPFLPATTKGNTLDLTKLPKIWKIVSGFEPIPFEKIGPKGM